MRRVIIALTIALAACGGQESTETVTPAPSSATDGSFTQADLDAYARGLRREIEAVKAAQQQAAAAQTPADRGRAMQASWDTATIPVGADAAGMPIDRYRRVRSTLNEIFRTLDYQGKIDGPMSIDLERADAATKERLARDPIADLDAESAAALRAKIDDLAAVWAEYVRLTAVAG